MRHVNLSWFCAAVSFEDPLVKSNPKLVVPRPNFAQKKPEKVKRIYVAKKKKVTIDLLKMLESETPVSRISSRNIRSAQGAFHTGRVTQ